MKLNNIDEGLTDLAQNFRVGKAIGQDRVQKFWTLQPWDPLSYKETDPNSQLSQGQLGQLRDLLKQLTPYQRKRLAVSLIKQIKADKTIDSPTKSSAQGRTPDKLKPKTPTPPGDQNNKPAVDNELVAAVHAAKSKPAAERDVQDTITLRRGAEKGIK